MTTPQKDGSDRLAWKAGASRRERGPGKGPERGRIKPAVDVALNGRCFGRKAQEFSIRNLGSELCTLTASPTHHLGMMQGFRCAHPVQPHGTYISNSVGKNSNFAVFGSRSDSSPERRKRSLGVVGLGNPEKLGPMRRQGVCEFAVRIGLLLHAYLTPMVPDFEKAISSIRRSGDTNPAHGMRFQVWTVLESRPVGR
ncbi:hypothetical protein B0T21DRAFT_396536 [Apiosordaria backusii]|uniref:Uncharacterized protein n=1 Tax=Apiosordaria backusii TaxID=314023 RepID=A0AA40AAF2_9PEZI|nr:hypothetical protein B0T21DRAFT_396536 [Apiosordaria backusii]